MGTWTREDVLKASDDWQWIPSGAETFLVADVRVIDYPDWARMGFYAMPLRVSEPVTDVVAALQAVARERGRANVDWWITPSTKPASLEECLIAHGADKSAVADILAYVMTAGVPSSEAPEGVDCLLVDDARSLDDAERVAAAVWGGSPSSGERRDDQLRSLGDPLDSEGGFRIVSYLDGRAIATGGCQIVGQVARLYGACTLPDARGVGGYRATLDKRLEVAWSQGARLALVHARVDTSKPILTRLGFTSYGEGRLFTLPTEEAGD